MKKIMIVAFMFLSITFAASAQGRKFHGVSIRGFTRVMVVPRFSFGVGYPYFGFGYPFFGYPYGYIPLQPSYSLNNQILSIKAYYRYKIRAARSDKSVPKAQRKQNILALKSEREKAIGNAEMNYRERRWNNNYQNRGMDNNQNPPADNNGQPGANSGNDNNYQGS